MSDDTSGGHNRHNTITVTVNPTITMSPMFQIVGLMVLVVAWLLAR